VKFATPPKDAPRRETNPMRTQKCLISARDINAAMSETRKQLGIEEPLSEYLAKMGLANVWDE
jgi:hypothetical protein